ncbi:beta family protein [Yersinia kristensenii]|uniref:Beta family protein n=1 Tax=Yersinia kristensenii TaxID=28152 RepID=A0AB73QQ07_YERKR|nr:beta family protein [Yersinia kristensenii]OVZ83838.1 beta family protein [Yersinia kristensenii]
MSEYKYFPLIKTRDAELKALSKFDSKYFNETLPIYELTKSRKAKVAPDGDIHRRMSTIKEVQGGRPFILDLTSNEKYINPQIEQLLNESKGFSEWRYFLDFYRDLNIIPMVHIYDDDDFTQVQHFVHEVSLIKDYLAVRLPYNLDEYKKYIRPIVASLNHGCKIFVIIDGEQATRDNVNDITNGCIFACEELDEFNASIEDIITVSTSFPLNPKDYGTDEAGDIPILEETIFRDVSAQYPIKYGDYASINIQQVEIRGGTFIPRIDIALDKIFIYKRYRREKGSYPLCAKMVLSDVRYHQLGIWADKEIALAAADTPSGISPSFWIAVRVNYFMTSRVLLRNKILG